MGMKVEGFSKLMDNLDKRVKAARDGARAQVQIGYSAPYAIFVHERLDVHHPTGQAKFLEQAMREGAQEARRIIRQALANRTPLASALALGGNYILGRSYRLVPVDTGMLRGSGFVKVIKG